MADKLILLEYNELSVERGKAAISKEKYGKVILENVLLQSAEKKNGNGRWYPKEILKREVDAYISRFVNKRAAMGELDHSSEPVVELKNVSHLITNVYWDNNDVRGTVEVLENLPAGAILEGLLLRDVKVGISSRGLGSLTEGGDRLVVNEDFGLVTWDTVSDPSTAGAYLISEGKVAKPVTIQCREDRIRQYLDSLTIKAQ